MKPVEEMTDLEVMQAISEEEIMPAMQSSLASMREIFDRLSQSGLGYRPTEAQYLLLADLGQGPAPHHRALFPGRAATGDAATRATFTGGRG